jgi:pimeloyl-ACP methyl ester carboxylesterase
MKLEIIHRKPAVKQHDTPLLFVHGAFHAAWCWDVYFIPYFVSKGFEVYAFSMRGHGKSEGQAGLRWYSLAQYTEDLAQVVAGLPQPPILIGHSMGGGVVQKYLETHQMPAAILLSSMPTGGTAKATLNLARKYPLPVLKVFLTMNLSHYLPALKQEFFSPALPPAERERYIAQLEPNESYRINLDSLLTNKLRPERVKTPLLIIGAGNDTLITPDQVEYTAQSYKLSALILPDLAHDMMLDPNWQVVADRMLAWLTEQGF